MISPRDPLLWVKDVRSRNVTARTAAVGFAALVFDKWQRVSRRWPVGARFREGRNFPWPPNPTGDQDRHPPLHLQPGELVEVKCQREIEATLDKDSKLRGLSFTVELLPYCGRRARVLARVERILDEKSGRMLQLRDCIILEDFWCEGVFRFLCRRKIYTYWREAWLRRV